MFRSRIVVTLRKSILDPQGKAVESAAHTLGFTTVRDLRIGKHIEFSLESSTKEEAERITEEVCKKLLANPVMEDYSYNVEHA
ncbi:MAG TPA: phosphoribosylformylglycinamidine synthase subunit PurS [Bacteroidota bacterium]|nr:phosphoribosylformylglycinamidine synthase subunit PurS [Bacteroidota bacterium]